MAGPLLVVGGVEGAAAWDELASIRLPSGEVRRGLVLEVHRDLAVIQVLAGTSGIDPTQVRVAFEGAPLEIPVGDGWLGRVWNGMGEPLDGGPPMLGATTRPVAGAPINPVARDVPSDPIVTGISAIDALMTLVRGQKLPVFSSAGLPHLELAAQLAAQANAGGEPFKVIVATMGLTHADAATLRDALEPRAAAGDLALFLDTADDPVVQRILTPRVALTVAEYLAFERDQHVLVILADMTSYCEALREVSAARGETPGRRVRSRAGRRALHRDRNMAAQPGRAAPFDRARPLGIDSETVQHPGHRPRAGASGRAFDLCDVLPAARGE